MKAWMAPLCLLPLVSSAATQIQTCTTTPTATGDQLLGCPSANVIWGPTKATDLVRAITPSGQRWIPFNTLTPQTQVVPQSGGWAAFGTLAVTVPTTPPVVPPIVIPPPAVASTVMLSWIAPTTNTDGTVLTDLASYTLYQGTTPDHLLPVISLKQPLANYTTPNLLPGTYYFVLTAVNSTGQESARSGVVSIVLAPPTRTPGAPADLTVTVTVIAAAK